ncbi:MAG: transglutaminase-like domain-containing protein [Candidatus Acidiferrales bacterium]|jgi:hypothetical protein
MKRRPLFEAAWYFVNAMLVFSAIFCLYSFAWEYSTRKYLQGFSEAIIPATATPIEKVETILNWMSNGPARRTSQDPHGISDRDPEETLNYQALLRVCGTATNAFTNLANASGLPSRRLLLLNGGKTAKHVVAEVWINNQWIVVDPSFRVIPRGPDGGLLTRDDLAEPATFNYVFERVPGYDMAYTYERTVHVRVARLPIIGGALRSTLDHIMPGWEDSVFVTLLVERLSFTATTVSILCVLFFLLVRLALRHYGESRLGVHYLRFRERLWRAFQTFLREPG